MNLFCSGDNELSSKFTDANTISQFSFGYVPVFCVLNGLNIFYKC